MSEADTQSTYLRWPEFDRYLARDVWSVGLGSADDLGSLLLLLSKYLSRALSHNSPSPGTFGFPHSDSTFGGMTAESTVFIVADFCSYLRGLCRPMIYQGVCGIGMSTLSPIRHLLSMGVGGPGKPVRQQFVCGWLCKDGWGLWLSLED